MSLYKTYIIAKVQEALDSNIPSNEVLPQDPGQPAIAPKDAPIFSNDVMLKLGFYKDKALLVNDFESWIPFLENVATEVGLNPAIDLYKIASILNQFRVEKGKEPL